MFNRYLLSMFLVLALVAALNMIGNANGYYYSLHWYDWVAHGLGGAWVALFALWLAKTGYIPGLERYVTIRNLVLFGLAVGICWEIFELSFGITDWLDRGYAFDTAHDLLMDVVGATAAALLTRRSFSKARGDIQTMPSEKNHV